MYIPSRAALLSLIQLPFSWPKFFGQLGLVNSESLVEQSVRPWGPEVLNHLGNLSPYHKAPVALGVSADLPKDCAVDQVILLHRHGSRGPVFEQKFILKLVSTLDEAREKIQDAWLTPELEFLRGGYEYQLVPNELSIIGRQQLFDHGVEFALRYPTFSTNTIVSTKVQRVVDSAHFFAQGFFGKKADNVTFLTVDDFKDQVSWLDAWHYCPNVPNSQAYEAAMEWINKYVPPIRDRLNLLLPGVNFDLDDIRGALYACPYDLAARGTIAWCDVFLPHELRNLEYESDLTFDIITGHDVTKGDPGTLVGSTTVKKLIERLTNETGHADSLYLDFAHDTTILHMLSAMGLNKDPTPLTPDGPRPFSKFRSSDEAPFAANLVWERFTCATSFQGPQVRLRMNEETFPLSKCATSHQDRRYGTCSLDAFTKASEFSTQVEYQNEYWNATCGRLH